MGFTRLINCAEKFRRNQRGTFAIFFAISLLLIMIAVGVAMDIAKLENEVMEVQHAADAAVLAGVREAENKINEGLSEAEAYEFGRLAAQTSFAANMSIGQRQVFNGGMTINFKAGLEDDQGTIGTIEYNGVSDTVMGEIIGVPSNNYRINAEAIYAEGIVNFIELHILVDTSGSMGLPATRDHQNKLGQLKGCSFACHSDVAQWRTKGIVFRIDIVRNAVLQILDIFEEKGYTGERMAISVHTFGGSLHEGIKTSTDMGAVRTFVKTIDLGADSGTNTGSVLTAMSSLIDKSGNGTGPEDRKAYIAFFTDGLTHGSDKSGPEISGLYITNPESCNKLKAATGATMFVFNVEYIANLIGLSCPQGHPYCAIPTVLKPSIKPRLTQCATDPEYAFPAETPEQISESVELFAELIVDQALSISR